MSHAVEIKHYKQLPDGQIAVAACCCGDPVHTSWHTMASAIFDVPGRFEQSVNWHIQRVANQHEEMLQAKVVLSGLVGQTHVFDKHSAKFEHYRQLSDGQLAIGAQCCDDEATLSTHIIDSNVAADHNACQTAIKEHCQQTANKHENTRRCLAALPALVGRQYKIATTANAAAATA
ncbi:MAG TPA: hypothetical protein VJW20_07300 [Candidatus Angelobacter sp.]|nr:hypothetical protein [Candidatus Angelobacter sp.]